MSNNVKIAMIQESEVALREVDRQDEQYVMLVDSVRKKGILNAISIREVKHPQTGALLGYGLIDGLHRLTAAKDAGLEDIPATIHDFNDAELLEAQVIANLHVKQTKPVEYSKQLVRILGANPVMTLGDLASKLCQGEAWIRQRLNLVKLEGKISSLVDEGRIQLTNAYALAKLPVEEQSNFVDRAVSDLPAEFVPVVNARVNELKQAKFEGRTPGETVFVPQPLILKLSEIKEEFTSPGVADAICASMDCSTPSDGFAAALAWILQLDPAGKARQVAKNEQRVAARKASNEKAKAERAAQRALDDAAALADISTL